MNYSEAKEMAAAFSAIGGFTDVKVGHHGFVQRVFGGDNAAVDNDGKWQVELWSVSAKAGNRNLEVIREYTADAAVIALQAKKAKGQASKRDAAALARITAAAERDAAGE